MTSNSQIVEPWKISDFISELTKQFKRREPLAANFTTFRCLEDARRFQLLILVSIRPHSGIIMKPLNLDQYEESTPYEEFSVSGNTYNLPISILAFEQYHRENGFSGAVLDAIIHQLDEYGALGPVERNR